MMAAAAPTQQVTQVQKYKANRSTPLWTWAWSAGVPAPHFRVNIPIHTVSVQIMLARWQQHDLVQHAGRRPGKPAGGHYSAYDLDVRLSNNAVLYCGVSTNADPPGMQHVWLQFLAGTGSGMEKRHFAAIGWTQTGS